MISDQKICLRVWGEYACFTHPDFHVERVSYPVITPSAARGILEAILMKPVQKPESVKRGNLSGFRWHILRIGIVHKGASASILRSELGYPNHSYTGHNISDADSARAQRHSLILTATENLKTGARQPIEYLIEAVIEVPHPQHCDDKENPVAAYQKMFKRRAERGQCYHRPYFGCREFPCDFELVPEAEPDSRINETFGAMLLDMDCDDVWNHWQEGKPRPNEWGTIQNPIRPQPLKFYAVAEEGWINVHKIEEQHGRKNIVLHERARGGFTA